MLIGWKEGYIHRLNELGKLLIIRCEMEAFVISRSFVSESALRRKLGALLR